MHKCSLNGKLKSYKKVLQWKPSGFCSFVFYYSWRLRSYPEAESRTNRGSVSIGVSLSIVLVSLDYPIAITRLLFVVRTKRCRIKWLNWLRSFCGLRCFIMLRHRTHTHFVDDYGIILHRKCRINSGVNDNMAPTRKITGRES